MINVTAIANMTQMVGTPAVPTQVLVPVVVPMRERSTLISILDAMGFIGGMISMLHLVFGMFANCVNKRLYLSQLAHDRYLIHKNDDYFGEGTVTNPTQHRKSAYHSGQDQTQGEAPPTDRQNDGSINDAGSNRSARSRGLAPVREVDEAAEEKSNYASRKGSSRREGGQVEDHFDSIDNWSESSTPRRQNGNFEMPSMIIGAAPHKDELYEGGRGGITPSGSKMRPSNVSVNDIEGSQRSAKPVSQRSAGRSQHSGM